MQIDDSNQMDWLHNEERLEIRSLCLLKLLVEFGGQLNENGTPKHDPSSIYGACHDYVSHGNIDPNNIIKYYLENKSAYEL